MVSLISSPLAVSCFDFLPPVKYRFAMGVVESGLGIRGVVSPLFAFLLFSYFLSSRCPAPHFVASSMCLLTMTVVGFWH